MDNGWIKLHRKLLLNPLVQRPTYAWLWILLLLKANHKPDSFMWNGGLITVNEGQFITGRKRLAMDSGIPEGTVEDILRFLETQQQIRQQKTTKYRLITILNWKEYQSSDSKSDSKATTKQQQADTNKNVKKVKKDKNKTNTLAPQSGDEREVGEIIRLFQGVNPSYEELYKRKPQREATHRMLTKFGYPKLAAMVQFLPKSNATRYAPTITTPYQLEQKLGELVAWSQKQRGFNKVTVGTV